MILHQDQETVFTGNRWADRLLNKEGIRLSYSEDGAKENTMMESTIGHFKCAAKKYGIYSPIALPLLNFQFELELEQLKLFLKPGIDKMKYTLTSNKPDTNKEHTKEWTENVKIKYVSGRFIVLSPIEASYGGSLTTYNRNCECYRAWQIGKDREADIQMAIGIGQDTVVRIHGPLIHSGENLSAIGSNGIQKTVKRRRPLLFIFRTVVLLDGSK